MDKIKISDAEIEIMKVLWTASAPMSAYEIRQQLNKTKEWERTTVLTLIRRLLAKGGIIQEKRDVYYYRAGISQEEYTLLETNNFLNRVYKGNAKSLVAALFQSDNLNMDDIEDMNQYFNATKGE